MKNRIEKLVNGALAALPAGTLGDGPLPDPAIERSRDVAHGDFATGVAMRLAKAARMNPRALAAKIVEALPSNDLIAKTEIAGPGFINFFMTPAAWQAEMNRVLTEGADYGRGDAGAGKSAIVEFVSANPTGPLHVGHGRQATFGATVANLLEADGWRVHREYYVNDAGRQMDILAASVWLRYLEACGEKIPFPANGYRGDYVRPVAEKLRTKQGETLRRPSAEVLKGLPADEPDGGDKDQYIDAVIERAKELLGAGFRVVFDAGLAEILADIRGDLADFGVQLRSLVLGAGPRRRKGWRPDRPRIEAPARARRRLRAGRRDLVSRDGSMATRRTASSCARTARRPTSRPTSPITSTSASAASTCS